MDGAKRLDAMILDLLEYSRVAQHEIEFTEVNLEEIIKQSIANINFLIEENEAQITYDSLPTIQSEENLMMRLFQNLIENSIKYHDKKISPKIHISAEKEPNQYIINIDDNGIGISPQYLEHIFTIFKRLQTHEEYEGSGIGLALAQRMRISMEEKYGPNQNQEKAVLFTSLYQLKEYSACLSHFFGFFLTLGTLKQIMVGYLVPSRLEDGWFGFWIWVVYL